MLKYKYYMHRNYIFPNGWVPTGRGLVFSRNLVTPREVAAELTGRGLHSLCLHSYCKERDLIEVSTVINLTIVDAILHATVMYISSQDPSPVPPGSTGIEVPASKGLTETNGGNCFSPLFYLSEK